MNSKVGNEVYKRIEEIDKELSNIFWEWSRTNMSDMGRINILAYKERRLRDEKEELEKGEIENEREKSN